MTWEKVKLGDLANSIQPGPFGSQLHSSDYSDKGTPIIMPKNMDDNRIDISDLSYINESHVIRLKRHQVHTENIVFARKGDVTKSIFITQKQDGWIAGSDCIKIDFKKDVFMPYFIYLQLQSPRVKNWLEMHAIGATMPSINSGILSEVEVYLPSMRAQQKIVSILSAYDDLIENNRRQIKLLEEAAERLYKEWFVKRNINSCIHGVLTGNLKLTPKKLSSIIQFSNGYAFRSKTFTTKGHYKIVTIKNVQDSYFEGSDVDYISRIPSAMPNHCILKEGDILLSLTGNVGRVCVVVGKDYLLNQRVGKVCTAYPAFSYYFLKSNEIQTKMVQLANGSAQQNLSTKSIEQMIVNLPNEEYICTFEGIVQPFLNQQIRLSYDNQLLQEARDRLLPKLMSGEVEV